MHSLANPNVVNVLVSLIMIVSNLQTFANSIGQNFCWKHVQLKRKKKKKKNPIKGSELWVEYSHLQLGGVEKKNDWLWYVEDICTLHPSPLHHWKDHDLS
jgi:hypothetical protein